MVAEKKRFVICYLPSSIVWRDGHDRLFRHFDGVQQLTRQLYREPALLGRSGKLRSGFFQRPQATVHHQARPRRSRSFFQICSKLQTRLPGIAPDVSELLVQFAEIFRFRNRHNVASVP